MPPSPPLHTSPRPMCVNLPRCTMNFQLTDETECSPIRSYLCVMPCCTTDRGSPHLGGFALCGHFCSLPVASSSSSTLRQGNRADCNAWRLFSATDIRGMVSDWDYWVREGLVCWSCGLAATGIHSSRCLEVTSRPALLQNFMHLDYTILLSRGTRRESTR